MIRIGKSLKRKSAAQVKAILFKRYPSMKAEINECIEREFGNDKGAEKLNAGGESGAAKGEAKAPKK